MAAKLIFKVKDPLRWRYCGYIQDGNKFYHLFENNAGQSIVIVTNSRNAPALGPGGTR
jgi:hypothetical protein